MADSSFSENSAMRIIRTDYHNITPVLYNILIFFTVLAPLEGGSHLTSHLNLSQFQKEIRRSLAGARDDRYVVD